MSRTIETIIRLSGESAYRTALKNCSTENKVLQSEMSRVSSEFRTNANSMQALTAKGEILSRMYDNQETKVATLRGALEKAQQTQDEERRTVAELQAQYEQAKAKLDAFGDSVDQNSEEYRQSKAEVEQLLQALTTHTLKLESATGSVNKYSIQLNRAEVDLNTLADKQSENARLMDEARSATDGCATSIDKYGKSVKSAGDSTRGAGAAVEALAQQMVASGIQETVERIAETMIEASEAAQEYEVEIAKVTTIADSKVLSKAAASSGILQVSTDLRKDAEEIADAAYEALSAGVETRNVLNFTAQSAQLATAGFTDNATAVDVLTTVLNAYKMKADQTEKVASTLVKTQDLGKVTVDQLAKVLGRVIPSAAAYSVNLDNIAASYALMTASGINAENTTTYISTMLDELSDSGSNVAGVLKDQTGKSFAELMSSGSSLGDVLDIIGKSVDNDKTKFSNLWSSATAGKAAIALFNTGATEFNSTLNEMANSSGTVAINYEKMTDVSANASQRLSVANKNLAIVVGNQLNPVLDKLRNGGAKISEMAQKAISASPILTALVAGLTASVGLLAAGISGLMIVKSVNAAMAALNITLAANPAVLITTAVVGLGAALATFVSQAESSTDRVDEMTASAQRLNNRVVEGANEYSTAVASIESTYALFDGYVSRLEALEAQNDLTNVEAQEYALIVEEIRTLIPGLNLELDENTGLLADGAKALRDQAAGWKETAIAEAAYARYKKDIEALVDAEYELAQNKAKLSIATSNLLANEKRLDVVRESMIIKQNVLNDVYSGFNLTADEASSACERLNAELQALASEQEELIKKAPYLRAGQALFQNAVSEGEAAIDSNRAAMELSKKTLEELEIRFPSLAGKAIESSAAMSENVSEDLQSVATSYDKLYESARESIENQIGLFDKLTPKTDLSTKKMIKNLQSQREAFEGYADNLTIAMERGVDVGLVKKLSDGSEESMAIIKMLAEATDEEIAEINASFNGLSEAKDTAADAMAKVEKALLDGIRDISDPVKAKAKELGIATGDGIIEGVLARKKKYKETMDDLADTGFNAYKNRNEIKSPAKRYMWLAKQDTLGLVTQYQADVPKIKAETAKLADAGFSSALQIRRASAPSLMRMASAPRTDAGMIPLLQQILAETRKRQKIVLDTGAVIGETVAQYDAALGYQQALAERGAL